MGFRVKDVSLKAPAWVVPADHTDKFVVTISFDQPVNKTSVSAPATVKIDLKNMHTGQTAPDVAGTFQFSGDSRTIVFISNKTLKELVKPDAGENIDCAISVVGTGANAVTDYLGEALDGDADGQPGGDYLWHKQIVG